MFFKRAKKTEAAVAAGPAVPAFVTAPSNAGTRHPPLEADKLRRATQHGKLGFKTTSDLTGAPEPFEAKRVQESLRAVFSKRSPGQRPHVFISAPRHSGAVQCVAAYLAALPSAVDAAAPDWVWVRSADQTGQFTPISVPAGQGKRFAEGVRAVVNELRATLPYLMKGEDYATRRASIEAGFAAVRDDAFARLRAMAQSHNVAVLTTPMGYAVAPMHEGKVVKPDVLNRLPEAMRADVRRKVENIEAELQTLLADVPSEANARIAELAELAADYARPPVTAAFAGLAKEFSGALSAAAFLNAAQAEILRSVCLDSDAALPSYVGTIIGAEPSAAKSVVVSGATDLAQSLVHAGKGAVVIDADRLAAAPGAWAALKSALERRAVGMPEHGSGTIPFDGSVLLVGEAALAEKLEREDPDFATLLPLRIAFASEAARSDETEGALARSIGHAAAQRGLLPLDARSIARLIDEAARAAGRPDRLTGNLDAPLVIAGDASRRATLADRSTVTETDIEAALAELRHSASVRPLFAPSGSGSSGRVLALGLATEPVEVWATVRSGHGRASDIARAGPAETSGAAALLWGYLAARYVPNSQLAFAAALVHEPPLEPVTLARTSAAEVYALLSALAEVPVAPAFAAVGWASPSGAILPVAGINDAIETAFDRAAPSEAASALSIIIPRANEADLMLRADLVEAARKGRLQIFTAATIEEGLSLLTSMPAGTREDSGQYPEGSFNRAVEDRLLKFARQAPPEPPASQSANRANAKASAQ